MKSLLLIGLIFMTALSAAMRSPSEPTLTTQSTPDEIAKLIDECGRQTTVMASRLFNYSFIQTATDEVLDKTGRVKSSESKVYEVYPLSIGRRARFIFVQIAENGTPLSADKIEKQRERAAKETEELEKSQATSPVINSAYKYSWWSYGIRVEKRSGLSHTYWYLRPTDFLFSSEFFAPRRWP